MNKPKILLGLTGSVASVLADKLATACEEIGELKCVVTNCALPFLPDLPPKQPNFYTDVDEWEWNECTSWHKNDPVLHIELRDWADIFVVGPLSANTLAKMANGLCDNLLTSVFRAWDWTKPVIVAPAMNTLMWESPFTQQHLGILESLFKRFYCVNPQTKMLACGDEGEGAMANISEITECIQDVLNWAFPLKYCPGIPINYHPGAFAFPRKHSHHTGVDLYISQSERVHAVEGGKVVGIEHFTGAQDESPWWNNTDCILVEGRSGVVCYGEVNPRVKIGDRVCRGDYIADVVPVLKPGKERPDIPGHSLAMLHIELYKHGTRAASKSWKLDQPKRDYILDPTPFLCGSIGAPKERLVWDNPKQETTTGGGETS